MTTQPPDPWGEDRPHRLRSVLFDFALGLVLALPTFFGSAYSGWGKFGAALLMVAITVRRVDLRISAAIAIIAGLVQVISADVAAVSDLGYAPIAFCFGAHRDRTVRRTGLALCVLGVAISATWIGVHPAEINTDRLDAIVVMAALSALVLVGGWVLGFLRWQQRARVRDRVHAQWQRTQEQRLREQVRQEQERIRIAADMHDVVAHSWAVVAAQADGARYLLRSDPDKAEQALSVIAGTARSAMTDVRGLLNQLRSTDPERADLPTEQLRLEQQEELLERVQLSGMTLDLQRSGTPDPRIAPTANRLLAESLTNALKHGDLSQPVRVREEWSEGYHLTVDNAVNGTSPGAGGHGVRGMRERIAELHGTSQIGESGSRWLVDVFIPIAAKESP